MDEFRIEFECKGCGFSMKAPFRDSFPNFYKIFVGHYNCSGCTEYKLKLTPGCSNTIQEISSGHLK